VSDKDRYLVALSLSLPEWVRYDRYGSKSASGKHGSIHYVAKIVSATPTAPTRSFGHKILSQEMPETNGKRKKARTERDREKERKRRKKRTRK
jgi:hypothetical protein